MSVARGTSVNEEPESYTHQRARTLRQCRSPLCSRVRVRDGRCDRCSDELYDLNKKQVGEVRERCQCTEVLADEAAHPRVRRLWEGPAAGDERVALVDVLARRVAGREVQTENTEMQTILTRGLRVVQSVVCASASTGGCTSSWDCTVGSPPSLYNHGLPRRAMGHRDPKAERDEKKQPHETTQHFP